MSENEGMTGKELVKALKKLSKTRKEELRIESKRGKGGHVTLYLGERYAVIPDLKKELKTGTLSAILKQLGVEKGEL
jgi:mRNA interferase HicA